MCQGLIANRIQNYFFALTNNKSVFEFSILIYKNCIFQALDSTKRNFMKSSIFLKQKLEHTF